MPDNSCQLMEDIKWILINDRDYNLPIQFKSWVHDGHSFIIKDNDGQEYRVSVRREG